MAAVEVDRQRARASRTPMEEEEHPPVATTIRLTPRHRKNLAKPAKAKRLAAHPRRRLASSETPTRHGEKSKEEDKLVIYVSDFLRMYGDFRIKVGTTVVAVAEFYICHQRPLETPDDFLKRLKGVFLRAYPQYQDNADTQLDLILAFAQRLYCPGMRAFVLASSPRSVHAALTAARQYKALNPTSTLPPALPAYCQQQPAMPAESQSPSYPDPARFGTAAQPSGRCWVRICQGKHHVKDCPILAMAENLTKQLAALPEEIFASPPLHPIHQKVQVPQLNVPSQQGYLNPQLVDLMTSALPPNQEPLRVDIVMEQQQQQPKN